MPKRCSLDDITNWLYRAGVHRVSSKADIFHVIADSTRRRMLDLLAQGEHPARDLGAPFRISQPAVSKHLAVLRAAGLVSQRYEGGLRIYRLEARQLQEVFDWAQRYERFWDAKLAALGRYLDQRKRKKA
jgi:DNA-binding transcriptional ArsR family regulator